MKRKFPHILIWGILILYLVFAKDLYAAFLLKNGKPVETGNLASTEVSDSFYWIDSLDPVRYDGEDLHLLQGWGFKGDTFGVPLNQYKKQIILQRGDQNWQFTSQTIPRGGLNDAIKGKDPNMDATYAGFLAYLSKDVLPVGYYRIGIRYLSNDGTSDFYFWTNKFIQRTPNTMLLTDQTVESPSTLANLTLGLKRFVRKILN